VVSVYLDEVLPDPGEVAGVVVTGSAAMVSEREPWSERAAGWLAGAVEADVPTLGICYGHQLLAHALGGEVGRNPRGREIGTVDVELDAGSSDPLLGAGPPVVRVQASHVESVLALPTGAERIGANAADPNHAFRFGRRTWGVQFHPEFDDDIMRRYIVGRRPQLVEEGIDAEALMDATADPGHGREILSRFGAIVAETVAKED